MRRPAASDIVLKALGLLLLTAAVLKAHELLTVPLLGKDLWSWRPFLIFQVEFELALGIWLLSGMAKPLAWLMAIVCFGLFCCVTLYKGLTGAASCGCFGRVHVNPWITLMAIDLPAVVGLVVFRPIQLGTRVRHSLANLLGFCGLVQRAARVSVSPPSLSQVVRRAIASPTMPRFVAVSWVALVVIGTTTPLLALTSAPKRTARYEVLEPSTWVGRPLPIMSAVDISGQLSEGNWFVVFFHQDCPDCQEAIPRIERMAIDLMSKEDVPRMALVELPPYGTGLVGPRFPCTLGKLANYKQWFMTTPASILIEKGRVIAAWEGELPQHRTIVRLVGGYTTEGVH